VNARSFFANIGITRGWLAPPLSYTVTAPDLGQGGLAFKSIA